MFNLLIADDEYFTIENLCQRIPWDTLGISNVQTAEDGVIALAHAANKQPDILLTDVRMPRMNGIALSMKLRELYPELCIIFMSGFSDKEYLKSAIDLSAFGYIEKPLKMEEVQAVLKRTVAELSSRLSHQQKLADLSQKYDEALPALKQELALRLTQTDFNRISEAGILQAVLGDIDPKQACFTLLADFSAHSSAVTVASRSSSQVKLPTNDEIRSTVDEWMSQFSLHGICGIKDSCIVIQLFADLSTTTHKHASLFAQDINMSMDTLPELEALYVKLSRLCGNGFSACLSVGSLHNHLIQLPLSYEEAMSAKKSFFFNPELKISYYKGDQKRIYMLQEKNAELFLQTLLNPDRNKSHQILSELMHQLKQHEDTPIGSIRNTYYQLLTHIRTASVKHELPMEAGIDPTEVDTDTASILENIYNCNSLYELDALLKKKTNAFHDMIEKNNAGNDVIIAIKTFIEANYNNPDLSLRKISEFCFLSEAHLCVVFKEATQKTLNQYITELRINKAKELLRYKNIKISDVAEKVGFVDGNYFAKTFKKITGTSPSHYRERY